MIANTLNLRGVEDIGWTLAGDSASLAVSFCESIYQTLSIPSEAGASVNWK
jgi:hypothetical protein